MDNSPLQPSGPVVQPPRADRTCSLCNKTFRDPWGLRRHRASKRPCHPPASADDTVARHLRDLQIKVIELEKKSKEPKTVVNNLHIHVNAFGSEGTAHITRKMVTELIYGVAPRLENTNESDVNAAAHDVVQCLMRKIYADPEYPENITAYLANQRQGRVMAYRGAAKGWQPTTLSAVAPTMRDKVLDTLCARQPWDEDVVPQQPVPPEEAARIVDERIARAGRVVRAGFEMGVPQMDKITREVLKSNKPAATAKN